MAPAGSKTKPLALALHGATVVLALCYALLFSPTKALIAFVVAISSEAVLCYISRPFTLSLASRMNAKVATLAVLLGLVAAFAAGIAEGLIVIASAVLILRLVQAWFYHWPGGLTDNSLPAAGLLMEAFTLSYFQRAPFPLGQ